MLRKLLSHAAIYGLAAQVPRLAGILALPVITPFLTTVDYGVAGLITAYTLALNTIHSLGLSVVMVKSYSKYPLRYKWIWRQLHGFLSVWSIAYGFILGVILWWVIPEVAQINRWELILLSVVPIVLFSVTEFQAMFLFQMSQRPVIVAIRSFIVGTVTVGLNIYTIAHLQMGYLGWFYANATGVFLSFLLYGYPFFFKEKMWPIFRFKWTRIKQSLKVSLPIIPHHFSFFVLDASDKLVMDILKVPVPRIGMYNIASSFGLYFLAASNAIAQAATPFYMKYYAEESKDRRASIQARSMTFFMQMLFLVSTFILCLWLKELFILLIKNEELQGAYPIAIIILMGYNYRPMYLAVVNMLMYHEHTKVLWKISTVAGIANILLNVMLVPYFGIQAAAFTTFASLMYMGYAGYTLKEYKGVRVINYYPWLWLVATIALMLIVYVLADSAILVKAEITVSIILLVLALAYSNRKYIVKSINN